MTLQQDKILLAKYAAQHREFGNIKLTEQKNNYNTILVGIAGGYNRMRGSFMVEDIVKSMKTFNIAYLHPSYDLILNNYQSMYGPLSQETINFYTSLSPQQFVNEIIDNIILKSIFLDNKHKIQEDIVVINLPLGSDIWKLMDVVIWLDEPGILPNFSSDPHVVPQEYLPLIHKDEKEIKPNANYTLNISEMTLDNVTKSIFQLVVNHKR